MLSYATQKLSMSDVNILLGSCAWTFKHASVRAIDNNIFI